MSTEVFVAPPVLDSRKIRGEHIKHETSVRSIGTLYIFGAGLAIFVTLPILLRGRWDFLVDTYLLVIAAVLWFIGKGLRALNPRARTWATIISAIGLVAVPLGTLINAYFLYMLHSKKGTMVLSLQYKAVIDATPDIKCRTSKVLIFLAILLLTLAFWIFVSGVLKKL